MTTAAETQKVHHLSLEEARAWASGFAAAVMYRNLADHGPKKARKGRK